MTSIRSFQITNEIKTSSCVHRVFLEYFFYNNLSGSTTRYPHTVIAMMGSLEGFQKLHKHQPVLHLEPKQAPHYL